MKTLDRQKLDVVNQTEQSPVAGLALGKFAPELVNLRPSK